MATAFYTDQYGEKPQAYDINNRLGGNNETQGQNGTYNPGIFDAQVIVMSNVERDTGTSKHLFALPDQTGAQMYRDFSIYIFSNQPTNYLVKIDNFTVETGTMNWLKRIDRHSDYSKTDIYVMLQNESGGTREFSFSKLSLLDSPWQNNGGTSEQPNNEIPEIIKPYIEMSQGEYSVYVAKRVVADIVSVIAGILIGIQFAALRADFRGIERAL